VLRGDRGDSRLRRTIANGSVTNGSNDQTKGFY